MSEIKTTSDGLVFEVLTAEDEIKMLKRQRDEAWAERDRYRLDAERLDALEKNWAKWGPDCLAYDTSKFRLDREDSPLFNSLRELIDAERLHRNPSSASELRK